MKLNNLKEGGLIYDCPPKIQPKRFDIIRYATWRMRLYQQLQSISRQELDKKSGQSLDRIFPKLCHTQEQKQFFTDFLTQLRTQTYDEQLVSHFICRMLYSRDLKNHDTFIKMERLILSLKLEYIKKMQQDLSSHDLTVSQSQYLKYQSKITRWYQRTKQNKNLNESFYIKIPFQYGEAGLKKRKCFINRGFVYADIQTSIDIVLTLYSTYLKQKLIKTRSQTQKLLQNDIQNQLKPFMDKAINSINISTVQQSQLNSQFKLNIKNIDGVNKKYFPPCMFHLNKKLKQNNHLKHDGRRQLWLFFKGCGMDVHDNKQYFTKYFGVKVANSELKSHIYNIEHAYGLVGKKQQQRPKMCRAIITGTDPKKDQHHGCPFKHWSKEALGDFLHHNYSLKESQMKQILDLKNDNYFQIACGRLFQANFKPQTGDLPQQITAQLGKSPHQYFIAGMAATQWINTKTLRPMKNKPQQNTKMELQF